MAAELAACLADVASACSTLPILQAGAVAAAVAKQSLANHGIDNEELLVGLLCQISRERGPPPQLDNVASAAAFSRQQWTHCALAAATLEAAPPSVAKEFSGIIAETLYLPCLEASSGVLTAQQHRELANATAGAVCTGAAWNVPLSLLRRLEAEPSANGDRESTGAVETHDGTGTAQPTEWGVQLAAQLLGEAVPYARSIQYTPNNGDNSLSPEYLLEYSQKKSFPAALQMLQAKNATAVTSAVGQHLLPALLLVAKALGPDALDSCRAILWETCRQVKCIGNTPALCLHGSTNASILNYAVVMQATWVQRSCVRSTHRSGSPGTVL